MGRDEWNGISVYVLIWVPTLRTPVYSFEMLIPPEPTRQIITNLHLFLTPSLAMIRKFETESI